MGAAPTSVVVEADGGSRGNPGKAAYGALLKDASTGRVLAERAERIGVASNNVAEYRGLIAGLELYREHADGADLEVRMDSKLVVEQMSGRWKIKHPAMRPLALEANRLAPPGTRYTWIPREQNKHADRLANLALDGPEGVVHGGAVHEGGTGPRTDLALTSGPEEAAPFLEQSPPAGVTGTLVLVHVAAPERLAATADWLADAVTGSPPTLVSGPQQAALASAQVLGRRLGTAHVVEEGLDQAVAQDRSGRRAALTRDRLLATCAGGVGVVVTGPTQVKALVALALGLPLGTPLAADLEPGSVTVLEYSAGGPVVRLLGGLPHLALPRVPAG